MKNFFKNLFQEELKSKKINFSKILTEKKQIIFILPANANQILEIIQYLSSWQNIFGKFIAYCENYQKQFFEKITNFPNLELRNLTNKPTNIKNTIFINLKKDLDIKQIVDYSKNSVILDINNYANIQFEPLPASYLELLRNFTKLADLNLQKSAEIKLSLPEKKITNQNRTFILDIYQTRDKHIDFLYNKLDTDFAAKIYFIKSEKNIHFPHSSKAIKNLAELFELAFHADIFFTDNLQIIKLFSHYFKHIIYLSSKKAKLEVKTVDPKNIFEVKNIIEDIQKSNERNLNNR